MKDDKTGLIDMLEQLKKEIPVEKPYTPDIPSPDIEIPSDSILRKTPEHFFNNDFGDKSLHKSSNMASQEAIDWANKTRNANSKLNAKNNLAKLVKKSNIPIAASIAALAAGLSGDANAASAIPILGEADSLGPEKGSEDWEIENPQANPELRKAALEKLVKK